MEQDKRWSPRYDCRSDVVTVLTVEGERRSESSAVDIGFGGAYVRNPHPNRNRGAVLFRVPNPSKSGQIEIKRDCDILPGRTTAQGGCAVRFDRPLKGPELAKLAADSTAIGSLDLARRDYSEVSQEIRAIQSCRSSVFLGTLAAIATWVMAATGLVVSNNLTNIGLWTAVGAILPYGLLTVGVMASIEKGRAVNYRRGFLAALTEYIRHDVPPPNYLGWVHLHAVRSECRARKESGLCPDSLSCCWETERDKHHDLTKKKHVVSNILDSFTAFSTLVYATLYAMTVAILIYTSLRALSGWHGSAVALAEGALVLALAIYFLKELSSLRKGKHSVEAQFLTWRAAFRYCRPIGSDHQLEGS
jgi:hypothetical protein